MDTLSTANFNTLPTAPSSIGSFRELTLEHLRVESAHRHFELIDDEVVIWRRSDRNILSARPDSARDKELVPVSWVNFDGKEFLPFEFMSRLSAEELGFSENETQRDLREASRSSLAHRERICLTAVTNLARDYFNKSNFSAKDLTEFESELFSKYNIDANVLATAVSADWSHLDGSDAPVARDLMTLVELTVESESHLFPVRRALFLKAVSEGLIEMHEFPIEGLERICAIPPLVD